MATMSERNTGDPGYTFKGHAQPPVNDRLRAAKNFLADEDVNRKFDFVKELSEIEEFVKDLEEKHVPCDPRLFKDVKVMATVQREWLGLMDAPPRDNDAGEPSRILPISNRLFSIESKRVLKDEKEAWGLANQAREDRAPFSTHRQDHIEFLQKLQEDESENPDTIEEATNLLFVEDRAYNWALKEPSLIPVWLHPRLGLANKGIRASEEEPWYRQDGRAGGIGRRPPPQTLPDYLQRAQDTINALLQKFAKGLATDIDVRQLEDYLSDFELPTLRAARVRLETELDNFPDRQQGMNATKVAPFLADVETKFRKWLLSFAQDGIQIIVGEKPVTHILLPGVFYVPEEQPSLEDLDRLARIETETNLLLEMSPEELEGSEQSRSELTEYLKPKWSREMNRIMEEMTRLAAPSNNAEKRRKEELNAEFARAETALFHPLLGKTIQLRYRRPGELVDLSPTLLYLPWPSDPDRSAYDDTTAREPLEDLNALENSINSVLENLDTYPGPLSKREINAFERDLEKIMFPALRKLRDKYLLARAQRSGRRADAEERDIKFEYDNLCRPWVNSLLDRKVQIKKLPPHHPAEGPNVLYFRGVGTMNLTDLADKINRELQKGIQPQYNPEDQGLYRFLVNLQYPFVKDLDERASNLGTSSSVDGINAAQEARRKWRKMYNAWVASFQDLAVFVRLTNDRDRHSGDPSIVYYHGSLGRDVLPETPESPGERQDPPLTRHDVDRAVFLLDQNRDLTHRKLELAARMYAANVLPPSSAGRFEEFRAARASGASTDVVDVKARAAISAFAFWERKIRSEAHAVPSTPALPAIPLGILEEEKMVNRLLEKDLHPSGADLGRVNSLIAPYWRRQLAELRTRRRARCLAYGVSQEQIDSMDMSIDSFGLEFQEFKAKCRARGFRIVPVETQPGQYEFQAQDPDPQPFSPGTQLVVESLTNLSHTADPWPAVAVMTPTEVREALYRIQEEINLLLFIRSRPMGDTTSLETPRSRSFLQRNRMITLLRPFFPRAIEEAWRQLQASLSAVAPQNIDSPQDYVNRKRRDAYRRFLDFYSPWVSRLEATGVRLDIGLKDQNVVDIVDGNLYFERKQPFLNHPTVANVTSPRLPPEWQRVEDDINELLLENAARGLSLAESKKLRALLRAVMPSPIAILDDRLRSLSEQLRAGGPVYSALSQEYDDTAHEWSAAYSRWVRELGGDGGVRLRIPLSGDAFSPPANSNILLIRVEGVDEIPEYSAETGPLPLHFQAVEDSLNDYIAGNHTEMSEEKIAEYLRRLWNPRRADPPGPWVERLLNKYGDVPYFLSSMDDSRLQAVIDVQEENAFQVFVKLLRGASPRPRVAFVEISPLRYELMPASRNEEIINQLASEAMAMGWSSGLNLDFLDLALTDFLHLGSRAINHGKPSSLDPLTAPELEQVKNLVRDMKSREKALLDREVVRLWTLMKDGKTLSRIEQESLKYNNVRQMWAQWASQDPDIVSSFKNITVWPSADRNQRALVSPGVQTGDQPAIDPPTRNEMDAVINQINPLFENCKNGLLSMAEVINLALVMKSLLPLNLQNAQRQRVSLEHQQRIEGLPPSGILRLSGLEYQFNQKFLRWVKSVQSLDAVLTHWQSDSTAMLEFYRNVKDWDNAMKLADGDGSTALAANKDGGDSQIASQATTAATSPMSSVKSPIIDDTLRDRQETRMILQSFAENYEGSFDERLLLGHMNPPLRQMYEQISSLRDSERNGQLMFDETQQLRTLMEDFARDYMIWYSSLTPEQIKTFKGKALDFTAKAEWRGVRRGAIELALNLLATNQEQHRPHDRFRRLALPLPYQPPLEEVPLWKPLDPWKRPVELDPFHYTKIMHKFRRWKNHLYDDARTRKINNQTSQVAPPLNYNGPFTLQSLHDMQGPVRKRANHLGQISELLLKAQDNAPRPLLERMCTLIGAAMGSENQSYPFCDDVPLTDADLDLLKQLCEPSWIGDEKEPFENSIRLLPGREADYREIIDLLEELGRDLNEATVSEDDPRPLLPLWRPARTPRVNSGSDASFAQQYYQRDIQAQPGKRMSEVIQRINVERCKRAATIGGDYELHLWQEEDSSMPNYFQALHDSGRIHFDPKTRRVMRIPPSGHPENKYVLSEDDAKRARYVRFNSETKKYEVQYDAHGTVGPPIVQPNKYQHFQQIAFRLGRDLRHLTEMLADPDVSDTKRLRKQFDALTRTIQRMNEDGTGKNITLQKIARDLLRHAPEFLEDIGLDRSHDISTITEAQAARVIQLQLIEESNNNWELRFPENEHVWDWVDDRAPAAIASTAEPAGTPAQQHLNPRRFFFSMRRWPVEYQSTAIQTMIKASGPTVPEKPDPIQTQAARSTAAQRRAAAAGPPPRERHVVKDGPPLFPFGETPYQKAFQDFRMEEDLADVPEFNVPQSTSIWSRIKDKMEVMDDDQKRKETDDCEKRRKKAHDLSNDNDIFALPKIPSNWTPISVSAVEKRHDLVQKAKALPGFPDTDEAFYSAAELDLMREQKEWDEEVEAKKKAAAMIVEKAGKPLGQISRLELRELQDQLNIDPVSERERAPPKTLKRRGRKEWSGVIDTTMISGGLGEGIHPANPPGSDRVYDANPETAPAPNSGREGGRSPSRSAEGRKVGEVSGSRDSRPPKRKRTTRVSFYDLEEDVAA